MLFFLVLHKSAKEIREAPVLSCPPLLMKFANRIGELYVSGRLRPLRPVGTMGGVGWMRWPCACPGHMNIPLGFDEMQRD